MSPTSIQRTMQNVASGRAAHESSFRILVFCVGFFALGQVMSTFVCSFFEMWLHKEYLPEVVISAYLLIPHAAGWISNMKAVITKKSMLVKDAPRGGHTARRAVPIGDRVSPHELCNGGSKYSRDLVGHTVRLSSDMRGTGHTQSESSVQVPTLSEVMFACVRFQDVDRALKLFDQMLEEGVSHDAHLISKAIVDKFFNLVSDNLCDMRIRKDGLSLFDAGQAHGLAPSTAIQNRLIKAWKSKLPKSVVKYLLTMKSDGFLISRLSYFALIISSERSNPEMVLALFGETGNLGITLDKVAYNSVLGACYHLGMYDEIGLLFAQMADRGLTPDIKTYRIAINASLRSNRFEDTVSVLETMHGQRLKFNGQDYHNAIVYCISLQRVDDAVVLFNAMVQANVIPLERSIVCLRDAGRMSASSCLAI